MINEDSPDDSVRVQVTHYRGGEWVYTTHYFPTFEAASSWVYRGLTNSYPKATLFRVTLRMGRDK